MKITIDTDQNLELLKICYNNYYGYPENSKVTKADIAAFLRCLVSANLMDLETEGND